VAAAGGKISAALKRVQLGATRFCVDWSTLRQEYFARVGWLLFLGAFSSVWRGLCSEKAQKP
jgi:hypothetical protein